MKKHIPIGSLMGLSVVTLLGFFGTLHWTIDLFAHFRFQYIWIAAILALIVAIQKQWMWVGVAASVCVLNASVLFNFDSAPEIKNAQNDIRIYFANTYFNNHDASRIADSVRNVNPDIAIFAEIEAETFAQVSKELPEYTSVFHFDVEGRFDLALLSTQPIEEPALVNYSTSDYPSYDLTFNGLRVIGTHPILPATKAFAEIRNAHLLNLAREVDSDQPTVVIGDMNITPWSPHFKKMLTAGNLNENRIGTTWPMFLPSPALRIPIDHVLTTDSAAVISGTQGERTGSDHLPIIVDVVY